MPQNNEVETFQKT